MSGQPQFRDPMAEVLRTLREIRFGSVEIIIHDAQVVQVERKEKVRFEAKADIDGKAFDRGREE